MKKITNSRGIENISLPTEAWNKIKRFLSILDEEYGKGRSIESLGEYIFLVEVKHDIKIFKERIARGIIPEYTKDTIRGKEIYVPRSLDVTELELIELIRNVIKAEVFLEMLKQELV